MHDLPPERSLDAASAIERIQDDITALGLGWRVHLLGSPWPVVMAELTDDTGTPVAQGFGKGCTASALVGALFEALEHWVTDRPAPPSGPGAGEDTVLDSSHRFAGIELCRGERVVELLADAPEAPLPCRRYAALAGAGTLHYPLFLTKPGYWRGPRLSGDDFPYASLARYASSSGTAVGATFEEACIHALGEAVEGDAVSAFLARRLYAPADDGPLRLVDPDSLAPSLRDLLTVVEREAGGRVRLIDIDRGIGVPAFLAVVRAPDGGPPPFGAGTSLDAGHAVARALNELLRTIRAEA
ncbi:MAG TPA: YcaO-like family protein, partial [Arenibaculum sp.]|nr:YcaO-like family protein [Arenibaculum sp.]